MTLRAALIGCGGLGKVHAQMVQQVGGMQMAAFCDVDAARAEQLCREFQGDYATSDVERIFSDSSIQVVYICTHHDTHAPFCISRRPLRETYSGREAVGLDDGRMCGDRPRRRRNGRETDDGF